LAAPGAEAVGLVALEDGPIGRPVPAGK